MEIVRCCYTPVTVLGVRAEDGFVAMAEVAKVAAIVFVEFVRFTKFAEATSATKSLAAVQIMPESEQAKDRLAFIVEVEARSESKAATIVAATTAVRGWQKGHLACLLGFS